MTTETLRYSDGYAAFARWWPAGAGAPAVLYLHGIQSHGGWYETSAQRLSDAGCAVLMPDRRGSGRNTVERGHAPSARRLLRDVAESCGWLNERIGARRVHIVGVSWGGKLAVAAQVHDPARTASLALVAPGLFSQVDLTFLQKLRVAVGLAVSRRARIPIPLGEPSWFTSDRERQEFIRDDGLSLRDATASFFWASKRLDAAARAARFAPPAPMRVFLAEHDQIIDNAATRAWVRSLDAWPARGVVEYAEAAHTLEFEPPGVSFIDDLVEWVSSVTAQTHE